MAKKYVKVGKVLQGKFGPFLALGDTYEKTPVGRQYTVQIRVKDSSGAELLPGTSNPTLNLREPFKETKDGKPINVPSNLLYDVFVVVETEE